MKVLLINGSPRRNGNTALALNEMIKVFEKEGIEAEIIHVGNLDIRGCVGCMEGRLSSQVQHFLEINSIGEM